MKEGKNQLYQILLRSPLRNLSAKYRIQQLVNKDLDNMGNMILRFILRKRLTDREQTYGCQGVGGKEWDRLGVWG